MNYLGVYGRIFNIKTLFKCFTAGYILSVFVMTALHLFMVDTAPRSCISVSKSL
jgi:hypothetical protein